MVARNEVRSWIGHQRWNTNIVPCLGIFGNKNIILLEPVSLNLVARCCCTHEIHRRADTIILVDVDVVTEAHVFLVLTYVLVYGTDSHLSYVSQAPNFPMRRQAVKPLNSGRSVILVGPGGVHTALSCGRTLLGPPITRRRPRKRRIGCQIRCRQTYLIS